MKQLMKFLKENKKDFKLLRGVLFRYNSKLIT